MPRFLIDEDLPRSLARQLRAAGFDAEDARDVGLRGEPDELVLESAATEGRILITGDLGFANLLRFPLRTHAGIVVARFPNELPTDKLNAAILKALDRVTERDLAGHLLIVQPGRVRLRRDELPGDG